MKTGSSDMAGENFVSAARNPFPALLGTRDVIAVVLGADNDDTTIERHR